MNRLTNRNLLQFVVAILVVLSAPFAFGQDSLRPIQFQNIPIKRSADARVLSARIVAGKTSDKEKFDAILSWVVMNLKYDYRRYNSGKAFPSDHSLIRTLRRRKGICTDYTNLMDSLCIYAGLQNVTITGYVKEVNFDVNDKLYFDNHAWNAVKLNGSWFLYDATWCSGNIIWDYTRLAKWRINTIRKLSIRTKQKELKFGSKIKGNKFCDLPKETIYGSRKIDVIRFFPRVLITLLDGFRYKTKEKFNGVTNSDYYLANPEMFAVTHFPNNPVWSFSQNSKSVADFVADSKSYDTPEYLSMDKTRRGTFCLECDDYESSGEIERETENYKASLWNNPRNHLLPGNYHLMMGDFLFQEVLEETDSLRKIQLMDSTEIFLVKARTAFKKARQDARVEGVFHYKKNTAKKYQLLKENRTDLAQLKKWVALTRLKRNQIRSLAYKSQSLNVTETNFLNRFNNNFSDVGPAKRMKDEQVERIRQKIDRTKSYCDSLTIEIQTIQDRFKLSLGKLWLNLFEQKEIVNLLVDNYGLDGQMRSVSLLDSYKFYIREVRGKIKTGKDSLLRNIDTNVLQLSDDVCMDYIKLVKLVKKRDGAFDKNKRNFNQLRRGDILTETDVRNFCAESTETVTQTICWNIENELLVKNLAVTFNEFSWFMRKSVKNIPWNSKLELKRYKIINRHSKRNQMRNRDAVSNNIKLVSDLNANLHEYRRKFEKKKTI